MVRVWIADITPLLDQKCYWDYYEKLPDFRKKKADSLRIFRMKAQSVGVWSLWEKICREYKLPDSAPVNFSHSGSYVMCAVQTGGIRARVGCDIEKIKEPRMKVAERFFCPEEYERIRREKTEKQKAELFYRYWVLKESFMKATGMGMALPADSFCISPGNPPVLIKQPDKFTEKYYYAEYCEEGIQYKMAVCTTDGHIDQQLHMELKL